MKITNKFVLFYATSEPFSQWHHAHFRDPITGDTYYTAEHYMMYQKAVLFDDMDTAEEILQVRHPREAKELGRKVKGFRSDLWDENKNQIVYNANFLKFTQNTKLMAELMKYPGLTFVEAAENDKIWGVGMKEDNPDILDPNKWLGENLLGYALTDLRDDIVEMLKLKFKK